MPKMKLVYITTVPFMLGFFRGHIAYLRSRGVEVHIVCSPGQALEEFGAELQVTVHPVPIAKPISPICDLCSTWRIRRVLRAIRPDILHAVSPKAGLLGPLVARLTGVPIVVTSLFGLPQMTKSGFLHRLLDVTTSLSCWSSDRVWCDSFSMRDYVVQSGLCPARKLVVLGRGSVGGVDGRGEFSPVLHGKDVREAIRRRYHIPRDARVLGFVGRIVADKGMCELAQAWQSLREDYADIHLLLVGPFEAESPLRQEDRRLFETDARVHLAGLQRDIPAYLAAMDINVMPSYREGFCVANIEAAAMALPVIATRIPGCVDSVQDGVTGVLVPPRDTGAFIEAIRRYLEDPALCRIHGQAGRNRVLRDFQPDVIWKALYEEYSHLLQEQRCLLPESRKRATISVGLHDQKVA